MLTAKQEKFVQNIVKGMSQREAYKNSYDASKMKDETIDNRAYELFKKSEIKERYEELIRRMEDKSIMSAKERQIWLSKVIKGEETVIVGFGDDAHEAEAYMSDKLKAMDILNKMNGQYVQRVEADVKGTITYEDYIKKVSDNDEY